MSLIKFFSSKTDKALSHRSPEIGSGLVRIAHKISSATGESQLIKIGEKYFRVRELG
ncbi:hypothetical protein [Flavobacterium terrae]|uniref:Uncharacterized protein n=1 Tax=Flavobacterium terrae TaxID=415425 RepID=A0A1M6AWZ4_9FLAO|nr:hypothetical protein [Flavobacterium terrae]SHI40972.1 hypothetical protein SAMN05444363_0446 [Flavobacterium terrae]